MAYIHTDPSWDIFWPILKAPIIARFRSMVKPGHQDGDVIRQRRGRGSADRLHGCEANPLGAEGE